MTSLEASERDPLLAVPPAPTAPNVNGAIASKVPQKQRLGPLEISRSTRYGILAGIWVATFLSSLNTTLVATLLSSISSDFEKSNQASWLGTSYLLATCTFTPLYGRLSNVLGRRGANQTAVIFAGLGTLACGLSRNMETLIVARFLSGLGGGGIFTTCTIITSDMYSIRARGLTQGVANIFNGLGMGLGGPIGGYISDRFGWRWAFIIQLPLFVLSFMLTSANLNYVTPGKGKSAKEVLKRIDYGGTVTLLGAVLSFLTFLSNKFNEERAWDSAAVIVPLSLSAAFFVGFVLFELLIAPEPVLAPGLLREKIPVLIGIQNFLVANCNFAVMYFFPMWFETVALTSASKAGAHLLPNSISMSCGSLFAGWMMHRTGKYKMINLIFGIFPFVAAVSITLLREDSNWFQMWFSIIPLGFGNAVVLQTTLIALLAHIPHSVMAVGTGFGQLFRGVGQVGGVGIASAIFQSILDRELRKRIDEPGAAEKIHAIRHSSRLVASLPPHLQRAARDSYAIALRAVFIFAAAATLGAYLIRLPIPEKSLDEPAPIRRKSSSHSIIRRMSSEVVSPPANELPVVEEEEDDDEGEDSGSEVSDEVTSPSRFDGFSNPFDGNETRDRVHSTMPRPRLINTRRRRLSLYESSDGGMDLESDKIGGSARSL
ncbi:MFS general substrate transporter [Schizopora paradoxa]|uniref:MFS general substrate transporter n=1 Tax=Schizopora paradoxa TaxID=27342 RepID=A0A0H2S5Y9_9AGAM|nr:MFS general substrate transporter [Schizopora paradoxa]